MKASVLYDQLEKDFIKSGLSDDWAQHMESIFDFLTDNFKRRSMGLVCDFAPEITKVYTAVFPSDKVMQAILEKNETNGVLFVHHPSIWDIRKAPEVFQQMSRQLLEEFKKKEIAIYNLHVPLDNYGKYSTSVTLAKEVRIVLEKPFAPYFGALAGVIGKTECLNVEEMKSKFQQAVGNDVRLCEYGDKEIRNKRVAIVAGGGNNIDVLEEVYKEGVNTFITGITIENSHSQAAHQFAKEHKINILGGTHYSTEKFACMAMCDYFTLLGLSAEYIEDKPIMEDL